MKNIVEKTRCCGCEACCQICPVHCIEMVADEEGFYYPQINEEVCMDCKRCVYTCPVLKN